MSGQNPIKRENIGLIFHELEKCAHSATRAELSETTGISQMTIGKIVDKLTEAGLTIQKKVRATSAGRSSLSCEIADRPAIIYDLSGNMTIYTVDMLSNIRSEYPVSRENFAMTCAEAFFDAAKIGDLLGQALILPDDPRDDLTKLLQSRPDAILTMTRAAALACAGNERVGVFMTVSGERVLSGAVTTDRGLLGGLFAKTDFQRFGIVTAAIDAVNAILAPEVIRLWTAENADSLQKLPSGNIELLTDPTLAVKGALKLLISKKLDSLCV